MAKCSFKGIPCTIPQGLEDRNTLARAFKCICIAYSIALERIHVDSLKSKHANPTYISEAWSQRGSKWCRKSINVNQNYFAESSSSTRYSASQSQTRHHFRSYFASYFHLNIFRKSHPNSKLLHFIKTLDICASEKWDPEGLQRMQRDKRNISNIKQPWAQNLGHKHFTNISSTSTLCIWVLVCKYDLGKVEIQIEGWSICDHHDADVYVSKRKY